MNQIELIKIEKICESAMNPRKTHDEASLKELSLSIEKQGVLQPITLRVVEWHDLLDEDLGEVVSVPKNYEIVCGARRYRACIIAGLPEIPSIVREMTDEEAFDARITENLQRRDVEPLDEALAFAELHRRGVSYDELAARFGKSTIFVRLRIKLNELVPEFKKMLDRKELQLSHALELCKLEADVQTSIHKTMYNHDYYSWNNISSQELKIKLANRFKDLNSTSFDKTECSGCQFNTTNENSLFPEYQINYCANHICFDQKNTDLAVKLAVDFIKDGGRLATYTRKNPVVEKLIEMGYEVLESDKLKAIYPDKSDIKGLLQSGEISKVRNIGTASVYYVDNNQALESSAVSESIDTLREKDKRNQEIQNENTIAELRQLMTDSDYSERDRELYEVEEKIMYAAMLHSCDHSFKNKIANDMGNRDFVDEVGNFSPFLKNQIVRAFIRAKSIDSGVTYSSQLQSILTTTCREIYFKETHEIEKKHREIYNKRAQSINDKIEALTKK